MDKIPPPPPPPLFFPSEPLKYRNWLRDIRLLYFLAGCVRNLIHRICLFAHSLTFTLNHNSGRNGIPIPPPKLRYRVHGELRSKSFLAAGSQIYRDVSAILNAQGVEHLDGLHVLDFGCGCARVLAYFFHHARRGLYTGTDIDADAISWNRGKYPDKASWNTNGVRPPLPYPNESFDVVLAISVFTHLDETLQVEWLQELHRILAPGGILLLSVHGDPVWNQASTMHRRLRTAMIGKGFYFLNSNQGVRNLAGMPAFYQTSFHSEAYVRKQWGQHFHITDYSDLAIAGHQTAVVMRKTQMARKQVSA